MNSNLLSRFLPTNPTGRSIYEELRAHDEASGSELDVEERAGLALDERNLQFHDDELANADAFNGEDSRLTTESTAFLSAQQRNQNARADSASTQNRRGGQSKWIAQSPRLLDDDIGDDDVPASLLIEDHGIPDPTTRTQRPRRSTNTKRQSPIPGPSNKGSQAQWEATQAQQRLHDDNGLGGSQPARQSTGLLIGNPREKAMWRWINVVNLDNFMKEVYEYYTGAGIWCMLLARALSIA